MKLKGFVFTTMMIFVIVMVSSCTINKGIVRHENLSKVVEQGLQSEGISSEDILYEESIGENKFIFITKNNALGLAYVSKDKDTWIWNRLSVFLDFESDSKSPPYMAAGKEIKTPDGVKYYLAMGKIFSTDIVKLTLSNDKIDAVIKKKDDSIFWFKLLENEDLFEDIKIYDKEGKEIKY